MSDSLKLLYLAERPDLLPVVAGWYFAQWGRRVGGQTYQGTCSRLRDYLNRDRLPFLLVLAKDKEPVGAAQLKFREMKEVFPEKEHWLGGVYVTERVRGRGLGTLLAEEIAKRATDHGVRMIHLQTERLDGGLYRRLGWVPLQQVVHRGVDVLVMERELTPHGSDMEALQE